MFNRKKQPPIKSLIAHGSQIYGDYIFTEGLRVDGSITGNIRSSDEQPSILVISETAVVTGEIHADHIIINGQVNGPVYASAMLELQPRARVVGDVFYIGLEMHQGATISGLLRPSLADELKPTLKLAANND
ncbi:MAG: hypothetical protein RL211_758 [Pseudomonadota bacterium]